jgi:phage head maturation protease
MNHVRSLATDWNVSEDGRFVEGRIFPFGEVAHITELIDGEVDEYDEEFLPGCTTRMRQAAAGSRGGAPAWVRFTIDHERSFDARLGYCTELSEADDGAHGSFRLYDGPQLAKARDMLNSSHNGLSVEFSDRVAPQIEGDLRRRVQINLFAVTATPVPVYDTARVLSVRGDDDPLAALGTPNLDRVQAILASMGEQD